MKPEIASLDERMKKGGDWKNFRDEIARLHNVATTEEEYVTLLQCHRNLIAVAKYSFDKETHEKILPIAEAEYKMFLNTEAMDNGVINPAKLERITRREIAEGRLESNDGLRALSAAGASILGDTSNINAHKCKQGDWLFYGMALSAILSAGLVQLSVSPLWLILAGFAAGWAINERERKKSNV